MGLESFSKVCLAGGILAGSLFLYLIFLGYNFSLMELLGCFSSFACSSLAHHLS